MKNKICGVSYRFGGVHYIQCIESDGLTENISMRVLTEDEVERIRERARQQREAMLQIRRRMKRVREQRG